MLFRMVSRSGSAHSSAFGVGRSRLDNSVAHDIRMQRPPVHQEEPFRRRLPISELPCTLHDLAFLRLQLGAHN
jgi:hypothetical protein